MRCSQYFLATLKEAPTEAEAISHKLMVRAGMIRKLASGVYTWLPTGKRVLNKVENIVRSEMDKSGSLEILMSFVQPAELWIETDRYDKYGDLLLKFKDRKNAKFVLGPTHEEVVTDIIRNNVKSYKELPLSLYQIQWKFRDELRPRFGIMRTREFLMKDAYSFHDTQESLQEGYNIMYRTYCNIFDRLNLKYRAVHADNGSIGGNRSQEFQVLAETGEDYVVYSDESDYSANIEKAESLFIPNRLPPNEELRKEHTPGIYTINDLISSSGRDIKTTVKLLIVEGSNADNPYIALALRGDHTLNEIKAEKHPLVKEPLSFAEPTKIFDIFNANIGSLGVVNCPIPIIADLSVTNCSDFSTGANEDNYHYFGVNWERDANYLEAYDLRNVVEGDLSPDNKGILKITKGIEVGHIFQLGSFYSDKMKAVVNNSLGEDSTLLMGCYGIGVTRIVAAAIEQNHDDNGIIWPQCIAPWDISIVAINYGKSEEVTRKADEIYDLLIKEGYDVLLDDRGERPGVAFKEMDLIGIPHLLVIGSKALENNQVEYKSRKTGYKELLSIDGLIDTINSKVRNFKV